MDCADRPVASFSLIQNASDADSPLEGRGFEPQSPRSAKGFASCGHAGASALDGAGGEALNDEFL